MKTPFGKNLVATSLIILGTGAGLFAENAPKHCPGGHRPPPPPILTTLDANGDDSLDPAEIANATTALASLDKNNDGQISQEEMHPPRPDEARQGQAPEGHHRKCVPPFISAIDADGDGVLSPGEVANASAALGVLDKNGDGTLSHDEFLGNPPEDDRPEGGERHQRPND